MSATDPAASTASCGPARPPEHRPAPWKLTGEGIILIYKFSRQWVEENGWLDQRQRGQFRGGLGYVMLVNYHQSPVGPYRELLIIPGKFEPHGCQSITRIFVDSPASTDNGRYNWGIPKSTLPMQWRVAGKTDSLLVGPADRPVFYCQVKHSGPPFPVTTRLLPIKLYQELSGVAYRVNPRGLGWGRLARVTELHVDSQQFPDVSQVKPLACLKVQPFTMHFPVSA
ncbi:MAG: hypothetical protein KF752_03195 [Pirellulaceae bacterium]|nr:hypothetical protein [Pirellulaceae bacterium]